VKSETFALGLGALGVSAVRNVRR